MGLIVKPERTVMTADFAQLKQIISKFEIYQNKSCSVSPNCENLWEKFDSS